MYYLFPYHLVEKGSKIILYGAGNAGKNFVKQIAITEWCEVIGIIDRNANDRLIRDIEIHTIDWIDNVKFDYIVITQVNDKIQQEVKLELINRGIEEGKIVSFISPVMDWDNPNRGYFNQQEEYRFCKNLAGYLKEIDPQMLVSSKRIDVMVRYLLFKDFMTEINNEEHLSLFSRFTFCRTGGVENPFYFSGKGKNSVNDFIEQGKELCRDIKVNGFNRENFLPLGIEGLPYDGLHRMAAALAAGEKLWVHQYEDRGITECSMKWFEENGFDFEDQLRIVRAFTDIYPGKCGMFVLYAPFEKLWDYIEKQIEQRFCVVSKLDFNYESNFLAFENVLRQIYWDWNQFSEWLTRKLNLLSLTSLKYRIVIVSDENESKEFYEEIRKLKLRLRDALSEDIDGRVPIQIHTSDNEEEFNHLKGIFLSVNQYRNDLHKINQFYRPYFLNSIEKIKQWCRDNKIKIGDICVVGTFVMELYGLKEAGNINIAIMSNVEIENCSVLKGGEIEKGSTFDKEGRRIPYDVIIENNEYHTVFADIKFCNLEFVYGEKKNRMMEKDRIDIKKIENWFHFSTVMKDKKMMKQQVNLELYKRGLKKL